jgi:hypothetical protein
VGDEDRHDKDKEEEEEEGEVGEEETPHMSDVFKLSKKLKLLTLSVILIYGNNATMFEICVIGVDCY